MNKPDLLIYKLIDKLTKSNLSFAIYRHPWTDKPVFVMQKEGYPTIFNNLTELNGKCGFVLSPFNFTDNHPGVIINPDITANGWEEIENAIRNLSILTNHDNDNSSNENICCMNEVKNDSDICYKTETEQKNEYIKVFSDFIEQLQNKNLKKLVLSRTSRHQLNNNFSPLEAFITACNNYPRMLISLTHTPISGTWIGSTPEIILSGEGTEWNTVALAGTMPMDGDIMPTEWNKKDQEEQAYVSEYINKVIKKFSSKVNVKGPYTARAGQLVHLKTDFQFYLKKTSSLGDLLNELHPTPAVCGLPKDKAYKYILEHEGYDRKYYSGIIGWLDPDGKTSLYVNLRCLNVIDKSAFLFAGGGIMPTSEGDSEWEETQHKMNTMRKCLE